MYTFLGFTESHSGVLGETEGFVQIIPGIYKNEKPINITGILLKCDCIIGSAVSGIGELILFSVALDKPPGQKYIQRIKS